MASMIETCIMQEARAAPLLVYGPVEHFRFLVPSFFVSNHSRIKLFEDKVVPSMPFPIIPGASSKSLNDRTTARSCMRR